MDKRYKVVNWNSPDDDYSDFFLQQLKTLLWFEDEFSPSKDKDVWDKLTEEEQTAYKRVLAGLTYLDGFQGGSDGIGNFIDHIKSLQKQTVFRFIEMEELVIHAKSYSKIFMAIASLREIDEVTKWAEDNDFLRYKVNRIAKYYKNISNDKELYLALCASCFFEGKLFYSSFFYPLYLSGKGKMVASGEIIKKILIDENIHSIYTGLVAQEIYATLSDEDKKEVDEEIMSLLNDLYHNELRYIEEVYFDINLTNDVRKFLRYCTNKVFMNLGKEPVFEHEEINPIVLNGISTEADNFDFFSTKGSSYQKAIVIPMKDEDWKFDWLEGEK